LEMLGHETEIDWLDLGGTSDAMRFVKSEFSRTPSGIGIDLFFGGGVDPFLNFSEEGLLETYKVSDSVLQNVPQRFAGIDVYDPDYTWYGACLSGFGIIYNRQVLDFIRMPAPSSWDDLGDSKYYSWVGSGDPRSSGSVHMVYEIILQAYGWEQGWSNILRMGGNIKGFSRSASEVPKDTALGEVSCGLAIDVYAWRQISEAGEERMGFCLPEGMTIVNPDGIGILKGAPELDLAKAFLEFVLSDKGQKLFCFKAGTDGGPTKFELGRIPVMSGLSESAGDNLLVKFDPGEWKSGFVYDAAKGSKRWTILNDLIGAFIIDTHFELARAWRVAMTLPESDPRRVQLLTPPLTEEELMKFADGQWNEPAFRASNVSAWTVKAKNLYRNITSSKILSEPQNMSQR
ncbi:MAG: extracellular solute-binding protein, partial [Lentisphaerae bacterium]|nr:extracellular solute-binding protein [Lentisphaerota bacterium]